MINMKNVIKTGVMLALLFMTVPLQAQKDSIEILSKLVDLKYNETTNSLEFTLELKAGYNYVPRTIDGDFAGMNVRWNLYLEAGVELMPAPWNYTINQPGYLTLVTASCTNIPGGAFPTPPAGMTVIGVVTAIGRNGFVPNGNTEDLTNAYQPVVSYSIPLKSTSAVPTSATFIKQRVFKNGISVGDYQANYLLSSVWSNAYPNPTNRIRQYIIPDEDAYYFVSSECPPAATWTGAANDKNWNNAANWDVNLVPGKCTYVTIPAGISNYPELTAAMNAKCGTIYFEFGGEVAHTWLLDYDDAKVDMTINDNRWYMVAPPLRDMYSGDYFLDASYARLNPSVSMMKYQAQNPETQVAKSQGNWSNPFNTLHVSLPVASGFAVWVDEGNKPAGSWTFTFPKDSLDYKYYDWAGNQTGRTVIGDIGAPGLARGYNTRFTWESANPVNGAFSVTPSGDEAGYTSQIVGNPFMSHLDLNKFYEANKTEIINTFYLWSADASFSAYKKVGALFMIAGDNPLGLQTPTSTVPPMQSFFVEKMSPTFPIGALNFTPDMETTLPGDVLKSTATGELKENVLKLDVYRNGNFQSGIAIRYAADAQNGYADTEDSWTLFPDKGVYSAILYSLIEGKAATINSLGNLSQDIELGIATPVKSALTFVCRNEENFNANCDIFLIDRITGTMQNLRQNPEYDFVNATGNVEGRFALRIVNNASSIKNTTAGDISIYAQNSEIFVNGNNLQKVEVFNLQGQIIARKNNINANQSSIVVPEGLPLVIVKAYGENGTAIKKLRIK